jgi:hypothetical protein
MPVRAIPKNLTVVDWNSKKGVIAKMAGETGIGAALAKLKTEWDKVPWDLIDPDEAVNKHAKNGKMTVDALDQLEPVARANIKKVDAVRNQLKAIATLTGQIETKWKASKVIPSSSRKHVGDMKTTADQLNIGLKSIDNDWKQARERVTKEEARLKGIALQAIKPYFASIRQNAAEVKRNPTVAAYEGAATKGLHQNVRGLNAALDRSREPEWIQWKNQHWKPLAQDGYKPTADSQVVAKVDKVLDVLDELERLIG